MPDILSIDNHFSKEISENELENFLGVSPDPLPESPGVSN